MALVKISRGADIQHNYVNGVSRVSILEGAYKDATVERISCSPVRTSPPSCIPVSSTIRCSSSPPARATSSPPRRVFNITEVSVFVPDFDKESVTFHCAADAKGDHGDRPLCHRAQRL